MASANSQGLTMAALGACRAAVISGERFGSSARAFSPLKISSPGTPLAVPFS